MCVCLFSDQVNYSKRYLCLLFLTAFSSMENEPGFSLIREGTTSVSVKFAQALGQNVTLIAYAELDSLLMIDKYRTISSDVTF